jgi:hypothetical protein
VKEQAPWSAVRNAAHSYGFATFAVDPGSHRGGITTIKVAYYDVVNVVGPDGHLTRSHRAHETPVGGAWRRVL